MNAKSWNRRLGKITFPDRTNDHAAWLDRGLKLLTDEEFAEFDQLRERVIAVDLEGMTDDELERLQTLLEQMGGDANPLRDRVHGGDGRPPVLLRGLAVVAPIGSSGRSGARRWPRQLSRSGRWEARLNARSRARMVTQAG